VIGSQPVAANENRVLAAYPPLKWETASINDFPIRFEAFYNDHFGYRHKLIDALNNIRVCWLHQSSSPQVCLGKNGWLFFNQVPIGQDYDACRPFTPVELARWKNMLEERRDWLQERGVPYVFVVTPDKQSVYPEMLPYVVRRRVPEPSRLDQLVAYLRANTDVHVVDLRDELRKEKESNRLYCATDSHWNDNGGYAAYVTLVRELSNWFPDLVPLPRSAFIEVSGEQPGGDLARMLGLPNRFVETNHLLVPRVPRLAIWGYANAYYPHLPPNMQPTLMVRPDSEGLPRAVFFHDSFAESFKPFLGEHFERMSCRWLEPYEFDTHTIEFEMPNIVIQQVVERKLELPFPPDWRAQLGDDLGKSATQTARAGNP
jgi:hypothetical protein